MDNFLENRERTIFLDALEIEEGEVRAEFLTRACQEDSKLRSRIDLLLAANQQNTDEFMSGTSAPPDQELSEFIREAAGIQDSQGRNPASTSWAAPDAEAVDWNLQPMVCVEKILGISELGALYAGMFGDSKTPVNIRIIPPHFSNRTTFPIEFQDRMRQLSAFRNPYVLHLRKFGTFEIADLRFFYVISDSMGTPPLCKQIADESVNPSLLPTLIDQLFDALQAGAEIGIPHGYLNASAIFSLKNGVVQISDYGINFGEQTPDIFTLGMYFEQLNIPQIAEIAAQAKTGQIADLATFREAVAKALP